ncbi:hypothetical protein GCM10017764_17990 [Sphingobacterium griseoflavum]|uniref:HTH merR-type domain-containing protein n=1 Tax=Sphingobacterium griseoflavum TaxID=1474952 RepID=A0ABQ3HUB5_9SPHI|nr:hypothetical protein GCM10017764_17990 [Sphingobacterium griseoflavum]
MDDEITVSNIDKLKEFAMLIVREQRIDDILAKPQINRTELYKYYGAERARKWISAGMLRPACQNGKRSTTYFDHKKVIELANKSFHQFIKRNEKEI